MIYALVAAFAVSIVAHYVHEAVQAKHFAAEREAWTAERRELLNRIQAPDRIVVSGGEELVIPDREPDEWALVGQIDIDPEYGLED